MTTGVKNVKKHLLQRRCVNVIKIYKCDLTPY